MRIDIGLALDRTGVLRAWARDRETGAREECVFPATERQHVLAAVVGEIEAKKKARGGAALAVRAVVGSECTGGGEGV